MIIPFMLHCKKKKGRFNPAIGFNLSQLQVHYQCAYKQINYIVDQYYIIGLVIDVSSFLVKNTYGLWFQLQWWEFFKNAENTFST